MPNLANIFGLLGFGQGQNNYQPDPQTMGLLGQLNRGPDGNPSGPAPDIPALQQQLNRGPDGNPAPFGLLNQSQAPAPSLPIMAQGGFQPDMPAPSTAEAGPAQMPPMPPVRPAGLGFNAPMPPERPASLPAPTAAPAGPAMPSAAQSPAQQGGGFFDRLGTLAGSIYGGGKNPGDNLIALGAGLMSGPNAGAGLLKGMSMVNANALTAKKAEDEQKKSQGQAMLAQHIAAQSGGRITPQAALGIIQSGNAGQFLTDQFRSPTSEQEYNIYKNSESSAGRTPLTFDQWYTRNKQIESGVGETAFEQGAAKLQVERLGKTLDAGSQARGSLVDIQQMREISGRIGSQGSAADFKARVGPIAEALGIKIDGLDDIQTFNSIVQRVAPTLREPGSGSTSDIEFKGMLASLPQLSSNPAARTAILDTMEAMARDKQARSEIAGRILNKEVDRKEGERLMRELPDPMTGFKAFKEQNPQLFGGQARQGQQGSPPVAGARKAPDGKWYVEQNGKWFEVRQ